MAILRDDDPRIGCLAIPISMGAGFIVVALIAAAFGVSAGPSTVAGLVGAVVGALAAGWMLRRG